MQHLYQFSQQHYTDVSTFGDFELGELDCVAAVLPFVVCRLDSEVFDRVWCSDASLQGFAVHSCSADDPVVEQLVRCRERWKYKEQAASHPVEVYTQSASFSAERNAFDLWCDDERQRHSSSGPEIGLDIVPQMLSNQAVAQAEGSFALGAVATAADPGTTRYINGFGASSVVPTPNHFWKPTLWRREVVGAFSTNNKAPIHVKEGRTAVRGLEAAALDDASR